MKATLLYREVAAMIKALPDEERKAVKSAFKAKGTRGARAVLQKIKPINDKLMELGRIGEGPLPILKGLRKKPVTPRKKDTEGYEVVAKATETEK